MRAILSLFRFIGKLPPDNLKHFKTKSLIFPMEQKDQRTGHLTPLNITFHFTKVELIHRSLQLPILQLCPLNENEAEGDVVLIETSLLFLRKFLLILSFHVTYVTAAMLVYRTIVKNDFWDFDSIIIQN